MEFEPLAAAAAAEAGDAPGVEAEEAKETALAALAKRRHLESTSLLLHCRFHCSFLIFDT